MKKTLMFGMVFLGISSAFAFPFRTSCNKVVNVTDTEGASLETLSNFLKIVNLQVCGTVPKSIIIYTH